MDPSQEDFFEREKTQHEQKNPPVALGSDDFDLSTPVPLHLQDRPRKQK
jgi:hypothetical protein